MTPEETARVEIGANIATRLGGTLKFDPAQEQFIDNDEAKKLLDEYIAKAIGGHRSHRLGLNLIFVIAVAS